METSVPFIPPTTSEGAKCASNQMERNFLSQKPSHTSIIDAYFSVTKPALQKKEKKDQPAMPDIKRPWCFFVAMGYRGTGNIPDIFTYCL